MGSPPAAIHGSVSSLRIKIAVAELELIEIKINQDVFYELMESNADIMKQIIKLLTSRIREANTKLERSLK